MASPFFASRNSDTNKDHANPMTNRIAATQRETIDRIADEANDVRRRASYDERASACFGEWPST